MVETTLAEINLTEAELKEIMLTPEQEEELKKKVLFAINKDKETGEIEICPMNERKCITLHGAAGENLQGGFNSRPVQSLYHEGGGKGAGDKKGMAIRNTDNRL